MIVLNWKCNPNSENEAVSLARDSDCENFIICPPFLFIPAVRAVLQKARLGSQDAFWSPGAYTGEVSVNELAEAGVEFSIIGHSERRINFKETPAIISRKLVSCLELGIAPILCLGELGRLVGVAAAGNIVVRQLKAATGLLSPEQLAKIIYVYEPSGAIGGGKADSPSKVQSLAKQIGDYVIKRSGQNPLVLYGGSVNSKNASSFLSSPKIAGLLVGGASMDRLEVRKISLIHEQAEK
jgi:triosephosphate isomerase